MVIVYSIEFGYIYLQLIIRKLSVDDIAGGTIFIAYAFYNFTVIITQLLQAMYFGSFANLIDARTRNKFLELKKAANEAKALCELGYVYQKKTKEGVLNLDNIYIMYKELTDDNIEIHRSHQGEVFENLENFVNVSD